ncbi:MAG TPA: aromatic-ring-hydroxylating dioxygenase subunit beta, partial [Methylomirabilota bacterium]|nr:aromatic-ring-hydroxylating dioxygenase subunit beta [Methylomirabilota bacterium]
MSAESSPLDRLLLKQEIESFLYREADLLDERRYEEWLELFTEDAHYWMPLRRNVPRDEPERE